MRYCGYILLVFYCFFAVGCESKVGEEYEMSDSPRYQRRSSKRGVGFSFEVQPTIDATLLGPATVWWYNWGICPSTTMENLNQVFGMEYIPMAWNGSFKEDALRDYCARHPECRYILAYNEPNLTDQCNETPQQSAANWPKLKNIADDLGLKIVSPAMNYGTLAGYSDPIKWLDEFFGLVPIEDVDAIAIHCYMSNAAAVKSYIDRFDKYNKPIWLTEFCAWENSINDAEDQMRYMSEIIAYLEAEPKVERYAWFIPRASGPLDKYPYMQLLTPTAPFELSPLGKVFVNMSTQDDSVYAVVNQKIEAEHYVRCNASDCIGTTTFSAAPHLRPSTDLITEFNINDLELFNFSSNKWVEYQVELTEVRDYELELRYSSFIDATIKFSVDGSDVAIEVLPNTNSVWMSKLIKFRASAGRHCIRINVLNGSLSLNNIIIK